MKEVYVLVKFVLNEGVKIEDWKKMSDGITEDIKGTDGLQFRNSAVDEKGNVYCILKWDTLEQRNVFFDNMQKEFYEVLGKEIAQIDDMIKICKILHGEFEKNNFKGGCLLGNMTLELSDVDEFYRTKLVELFTNWENGIIEHIKKIPKTKR